jgi:hypothetical protein
VLVQQHPDQQRERVASEQLVGVVVPGDAEGRHMEMVGPHPPIAVAVLGAVGLPLAAAGRAD